VVAPDDEDLDIGGIQAAQLLGEKARPLHRDRLAVIKVAGQQERAYLLVKAHVDDTRENLAAGVADEFREPRIAQSERTQRRGGRAARCRGSATSIASCSSSRMPRQSKPHLKSPPAWARFRSTSAAVVSILMLSRSSSD
jgi:hypothetical protein